MFDQIDDAAFAGTAAQYNNIQNRWSLAVIIPAPAAAAGNVHVCLDISTVSVASFFLCFWFIL